MLLGRPRKVVPVLILTTLKVRGFMSYRRHWVHLYVHLLIKKSIWPCCKHRVSYPGIPHYRKWNDVFAVSAHERPFSRWRFSGGGWIRWRTSERWSVLHLHWNAIAKINVYEFDYRYPSCFNRIGKEGQVKLSLFTLPFFFQQWHLNTHDVSSINMNMSDLSSTSLFSIHLCVWASR